MLLNGQPVPILGLRCSNALISDAATSGLINNLDLYKSYGINTVSVYFQGSRFGDVRGYRRDGTLDPVYAQRMGRIIEASDEKGMVVLVGYLYWGKYSKEQGYYNVINIGVYTDSMKEDIYRQTREHLGRGWGYMLASTWLQGVPPYGPNAHPGGDGSAQKPGIKWWLEKILEDLSDRKLIGYPFAGFFGQSADWPTEHEDQMLYLKYTIVPVRDDAR